MTLTQPQNPQLNGVLPPESSTPTRRAQGTRIAAIILCVVAALLLLLSLAVVASSWVHFTQAKQDYASASQRLRDSQTAIEQAQERLLAVQHSPQMDTYRADEVAAQHWCDQAGLGTIDLLSNQGKNKDSILRGTTYGAQVAAEKCPVKVRLFDASSIIVDTVFRDTAIDCDLQADGTVRVQGTINALGALLLPAEIQAQSVDLRFRAESLAGSQVVEGHSTDVLAVSPGEVRSFQAEIPAGAVTPDTCQVRLQSWWPTGF